MLFLCDLFTLITPCPNNSLMIKLRKIQYKSFVLSLIMLTGLTVANYKDNKIYPLHNLLCKSYSDDNIYAFIFSKLFLYSKYLEWFDSLFLHLSNKPISQLQYTHHMSTAILVYVNTYPEIESYGYIPISLNCFVHIFMYWYFAYQKEY